DGVTVGLRLSAPIVRLQRTKRRLSKEISALMTNIASDGTELKLRIFDNDVEIWVSRHGDLQYKKVSAVIYNPHSSPNILENAVYALDNRIKTKIEKCSTVTKRPL